MLDLCYFLATAVTKCLYPVTASVKASCKVASKVAFSDRFAMYPRTASGLTLAMEQNKQGPALLSGCCPQHHVLCTRWCLQAQRRRSTLVSAELCEVTPSEPVTLSGQLASLDNCIPEATCEVSLGLSGVPPLTASHFFHGNFLMELPPVAPSGPCSAAPAESGWFLEAVRWDIFKGWL